MAKHGKVTVIVESETLNTTRLYELLKDRMVSEAYLKTGSFLKFGFPKPKDTEIKIYIVPGDEEWEDD